jgi:hypothetical protein
MEAHSDFCVKFRLLVIGMQLMAVTLDTILVGQRCRIQVIRLSRLIKQLTSLFPQKLIGGGGSPPPRRAEQTKSRKSPC